MCLLPWLVHYFDWHYANSMSVHKLLRLTVVIIQTVVFKGVN